MIELKVLDNLSEVVSYNFPHFPIRAKIASLSQYPNMSAVSHWHDDVEFILILDGHMAYSVNGCTYLLHKGEGIFVNSQQLHYGFSMDFSECEFLCILLHPSLLSPTEHIKTSYINSVCKNPMCQFFIFNQSISWQRTLIDNLKQIYTLCTQESPGFELGVLSLFFSIWLSLYQNMNSHVPSLQTPLDKNLEHLHDMVGYIQRNYQNKINLKDIALAGNVCRSRCCDIFNQLLFTTPISYLMQYRIAKSIELLSGTSLSITEIALQCGFNSSSYYTEIFRKQLDQTPSEYRKNLNQ